MSNLLKETIETIERSGRTTEDVVFVGSADGEYGISWEEFTTIADFVYDDGYGTAEIASDLVVVFSDGEKLWRAEYDGSEWWDYHVDNKADYSLPKKRFTRVHGTWDGSIAGNNQADENTLQEEKVLE